MYIFYIGTELSIFLKCIDQMPLLSYILFEWKSKGNSAGKRAREHAHRTGTRTSKKWRELETVHVKDNNKIEYLNEQSTIK